jgi:hypothetical protein
MNKARLGRPPVYDWESLVAGGEEHDFVYGQDFDCMPSSFAAIVRYTARKYKVDYEVSVDGDHVLFVFMSAEPGAKAG